MNNIFLFILLMIGYTFIVIEITKTLVYNDVSSRIIYRYLPRPNDDLYEPSFVSRIFSDMFKRPSAWVNGIGGDDKAKYEITKGHISQI